MSRFKLNTHSKHTSEDPQRVDLPVFFLALLLWGRGSSTGKAVRTLEETVQVIYFSLQTVCFSSVEKFHPHPPPQKNVYLQKDRAGSVVYSARGTGILSVGLNGGIQSFHLVL